MIEVVPPGDQISNYNARLVKEVNIPKEIIIIKEVIIVTEMKEGKKIENR